MARHPNSERVMRLSHSGSAVFIVLVLTLLTASLLIVSFRVRSTTIDLNDATDRAVRIGNEIGALLSAEINSVVGFQATQQTQFRDNYRAQATRIADRLTTLQGLMPPLGAAVRARHEELQSAVRDWHHNIDSRQLVTRVMESGEFREAAFESLLVMRHGQAAAHRFNEEVLSYQSAEQLREERLASLFMALAIVFGPLAISAVLLMTRVFARLNATTSYMERRAREEEALRQVGQSLTGGLSMPDVLRRITDAAALLGQAEDVCIETVDRGLNEATCVARLGEGTPGPGAKAAYVGSLAQEALEGGASRVVENVDLEGRPDSPFRNLVRRSGNSSAMVIPLRMNNQPLGAMCLIRRAPHGFTYADAPKMHILADMAAIAMHRARTIEQLHALEEDEHFLAQASVALASSLDYKRTVHAVAHLAVPRLADVCIVHLAGGSVHADTVCADSIDCVVAQQLQDKHRERPDLAISVESVMRTGTPLLLREVPDEMLKEYAVDEDHLNALRRLRMTSAMVLPMYVARQTIGALVFFAVGDRHFDDDDLTRAQRIAQSAAMAIHNTQLYTVANAALELRDEVLRTVSHDLRNPLASIQLSVALLKKDSLPNGRRQKLLQSITSTSQRMNRLIDDLLVVGRLRAGQPLPLDRHREDPADIVEQMCEIMEPQARRHSVALRCSKPNTPLPSIVVDRTRIIQALTNLLDNAFKFTPEGGEIVVSCAPSNGEIRFAVADSGTGIDPADLGRLFDPFWQAQGAAHRGTGLGLAIVKAIVEQHGGRIWVESQPGAGTTVTFTVPVAAAGEQPLKAA